MKGNTLLIGALAFAAGYYASKMMGGTNEPAAVGASWRCQRNPNAPGCDQVRKIHTVILPVPAQRMYQQGRNIVAGL